MRKGSRVSLAPVTFSLLPAAGKQPAGSQLVHTQEGKTAARNPRPVSGSQQSPRAERVTLQPPGQSGQSGARPLTFQGGGQHGVLQVHVWSDDADPAVGPRAGARGCCEGRSLDCRSWVEQESTNKAICKVTCSLQTSQNSPEMGQVPPYVAQCGRADLPALNVVIKQSKTVSLHSPPKDVLPSDQLSQTVPQSKLPRLNAPGQKAAASLPSTALPRSQGNCRR